AALDQRRGEAEVEAEQGRFIGGALQQPVEHLFARPDVPRTNQPRRRIAARFANRDTLVPLPFRARPVDRDIACEAPHFRFRGFTFGLAATHSRDRSITSRTRSSSLLS